MNPEFAALVRAVLERFFRQNGRAAPEAAVIGGLAARLWALVRERGLPPALARGERGAAYEMPTAEAEPLVARALGELRGDELWATPARQLVKACFQPEFRQCRESYREREEDGTCRRQQLGKARERVSGSHCVDCPYWLELSPEQHGKLLAKAWAGDTAEFAAARGVFLPEDFRALRRWVRAQAATGGR